MKTLANSFKDEQHTHTLLPRARTHTHHVHAHTHSHHVHTHTHSPCAHTHPRSHHVHTHTRSHHVHTHTLTTCTHTHSPCAHTHTLSPRAHTHTHSPRTHTHTTYTHTHTLTLCTYTHSPHTHTHTLSPCAHTRTHTHTHKHTLNMCTHTPHTQMTKHAWSGYVQYAWGENELKPMTKRGHSPVIFGHSRLGATIVDSLDTLYLTGLKEEYERAKQWVQLSLNLDEVSLFTTLGPLASAGSKVMVVGKRGKRKAGSSDLSCY